MSKLKIGESISNDHANLNIDNILYHFSRQDLRELGLEGFMPAGLAVSLIKADIKKRRIDIKNYKRIKD
jgi:hypothetical protein